MSNFLLLGGDSKLAKCFFELYGNKCISLTRKECDVTSEKSIEEALVKFNPKFVLNCAAMTDVNKCELNPQECLKINTLGVYLLNKICLKLNKKLIHISSDYAKKPQNTYGWSKYLSEKVVDKKFLVIRTNFYNDQTYIVKNLLLGSKTNVYKNVFFNPISINRLAKEIYANANKSGILNFFTTKKISYLQFAHIFCKIFNIDSKLIYPTVFENNDIIKRPFNSYVKSDIKLEIKNDLINFRTYYYENRS